MENRSCVYKGGVPFYPQDIQETQDRIAILPKMKEHRCFSGKRAMPKVRMIVKTTIDSNQNIVEAKPVKFTRLSRSRRHKK